MINSRSTNSQKKRGDKKTYKNIQKSYRNHTETYKIHTETYKNHTNKKQVIKPKELQKKFLQKLELLMTTLSHLIVRDGEGASKFITVEVVEAKYNEDARKVARSIINSPLIKTAMAGSDSNWGRIIMAIGKADAQIFPEKISLNFGKLFILKMGSDHSGHTMDEATKDSIYIE